MFSDNLSTLIELHDICDCDCTYSLSHEQLQAWELKTWHDAPYIYAVCRNRMQ